MEYGFFHPTFGYWQTLTYPSQEILSSYPEGTTQITLKPSADYAWNGSEWVLEASE